MIPSLLPWFDLGSSLSLTRQGKGGLQRGSSSLWIIIAVLVLIGCVLLKLLSAARVSCPCCCCPMLIAALLIGYPRLRHAGWLAVNESPHRPAFIRPRASMDVCTRTHEPDDQIIIHLEYSIGSTLRTFFCI
jgi:hypothetical protein